MRGKHIKSCVCKELMADISKLSVESYFRGRESN
uniref:Uncharacterized protein n=1 Tax=Siphoviridae sp. ctGQT3 TaxID=2825412 RepID=A0A8S5UE27_9CAUD|nr:MAG TPA: hypothetical protein [Siphoviridae sp. ctGQT3]